MARVLRSIDVEKREAGLDRKLGDLRRLAARLKAGHQSPLRICRLIVENRLLDRKTHEFFAGLPREEKHYWISSLYALLMPEARRRRLAAYFTPPHLVDHVIDVLMAAGIKPGSHKILDPASGGAAFLVPLSTRIAEGARRNRLPARAILKTIETTLAGIEIDAGLADLSRLLLGESLAEEIRISGKRSFENIVRSNALKIDASASQYDAVIGNPPYGRILQPSKEIQKQFALVIESGYVNLYSLFIAQSVQWVRPGGIICLVVPISFIGGPHFGALRQYLLQQTHVLRIDPIDKRTDVFLDVMYDVCVLVLKKKGGSLPAKPPVSSLLLPNEPPRSLGRIDLPAFPNKRVWAIPNDQQSGRLFEEGLATLEDYGYITKAGYFVWNREKDRYRTGKKPKNTEVPLFWAHNVKPNKLSAPSDRDGKTGFVKIEAHNTAVIRADAILLQRTSNRRQPHRLLAGLIRQREIPGGRGFVSENHTVLVLPDTTKRQKLPLGMLCRLLNTDAVDARFRRISGTVSVSVKALRSLPLPAPAEVRRAFKLSRTDDERAAEAYKRSIRTSVPSERRAQ